MMCGDLCIGLTALWYLSHPYLGLRPRLLCVGPLALIGLGCYVLGHWP